MNRSILSALAFIAGCASPGLHEGRSALRKDEQGYLGGRPQVVGSPFARFWVSPKRQRIGLMQWWEDQSRACPDAPPNLLQSIRDELGRLNQPSRTGDNMFLAVIVYRYDKGGIWMSPTAYYEIVVRDLRGQLVWAAQDSIETRENLARSLADEPATIIAREMLRKVRLVLGNR